MLQNPRMQKEKHTYFSLAEKASAGAGRKNYSNITGAIDKSMRPCGSGHSTNLTLLFLPFVDRGNFRQGLEGSSFSSLV